MGGSILYKYWVVNGICIWRKIVVFVVKGFYVYVIVKWVMYNSGGCCMIGIIRGERKEREGDSELSRKKGVKWVVCMVFL